MVNVRILQRMVVNHDHFIVVLCGDCEPAVVPVHLVGPEVTEGAIGIHVGDGSKQGLLGGFVFKRDHEQLIVAVRIGEFDTAVHIEF